jgi:ElaB/YqjD/DUF883 family membrane-anchored ribosome-binding protein
MSSKKSPSKSTRRSGSNDSVRDLLHGKTASRRNGHEGLVSQLKDIAEDKVEQIGEVASDAYDTTKEHIQSWKESGANFIRDRPYTSVFVGLGVGALLCLILRRR